MSNYQQNISAVVIYGDLLSKSQHDLFITIVMVAICNPIALFGAISNCINMAVFYRQGFTDSVNISLFALAVSDFGALLTLLYVNISLAPWWQTADINIKPRDVGFLVGSWPHICFSRATCWITVFITLERCLCISLPFKVKAIFVPKLVVGVLVVIFALSALGIMPIYFTFKLKWIFDISVNKSILQQVIEANKSELKGVTYLEIFFQFVSFATVTFLTEFLIIKLKQTTKWRASATSGDKNTSTISKRDKKIIRMIILITSILIVCYIPSTLLQAVWLIEPRFSSGGQYNNAQNACWLFGFLMEGINSSVGIFIYYRMSSSYRQTFQSSFCINKK